MATFQNDQRQRTIPAQTLTGTNIYLAKADEWLHNVVQGTPNILTLSNLTCGLFSLIMSMNGFYRFGSLFIIAASVCDVFDGRLARYLKTDGPMGVQLDSLADIVSFGVAPVILAYSISHWSFLMTIAFVVFPSAGAWRLGRFNVNPTQDYFVGLPITAAGLIVSFLALFSYTSPLIMIALASLMISTLKVPKL